MLPTGERLYPSPCLGQVSCWVEPVLQNWGGFGGVWGWGGYAGGLCPSSPGWCGAAPRSSRVGASLGSEEPRALLRPTTGSWPSSLGSGPALGAQSGLGGQ